MLFEPAICTTHRTLDCGHGRPPETGARVCAQFNMHFELTAKHVFKSQKNGW